MVRKPSKQDGTPPEPTSPGGFFKRLRARLNRGDSWLTYDLANLLPGRKIDGETLEELETHLLLADVGVEATSQIIDGLSRRVERKELTDIEALRVALRDEMLQILAPCSVPLVIPRHTKPFLILMVGVNGSGKTTTIGKLARHYADEGRSVMLAAGDTFRAAAIEQLQTWGERNAVPVIAQGQGADPAAVLFDAFEAARARDVDVLLADTAGRLHTHGGLMDELRKIKRVIGRLDENAPHETLLVLDANNGQNALIQAEQFHQAIGVTGLVLTKLDGTAKGGVMLAIARRIGVPIRYIGVGEQVADLGPFDAAEYVNALLTPP